jgi:Domain of unknown function (DUF4386)
MNPAKKTARVAGLLYFIWVLTGIYGFFYISSQTIVMGNAAATAGKLLANEFLFRTGIINDIISNTIWMFIALVLYRLFRQVNERQAKLLVAFVIVQIPAVFFIEALNITSLMIFKGEILKTFELSQRHDLAMLLLKISDHGTIALETFWGLWLLPFGQLIYKSKFIPRMLGVFLILNGIAYIIHSFTSLLFPEYQAIVRQFAIPFWILGEILIMLWLLIKGVKVQQVEVY